MTEMGRSLEEMNDETEEIMEEERDNGTDEWTE